MGAHHGEDAFAQPARQQVAPAREHLNESRLPQPGKIAAVEIAGQRLRHRRRGVELGNAGRSFHCTNHGAIPRRLQLSAALAAVGMLLAGRGGETLAHFVIRRL